MDRFSQAVIRHKRLILAIFLVAAAISALLIAAVNINYNMIDYLPQNARSTVAVKLMEEEFGTGMPNARVMISDVSLQEALEYKKKISETDGVVSVSWLDDVIGVDTLKAVPLEFLDTSVIESYYKGNNALISLAVERGKETDAVDTIYELIGESNAAAGEAVNIAEIQKMSVSEVVNAMLLLLPIVIILLIITTTSWIEPILFLSSIGVAVAINMGTNIIFDDVSYITRTVSPVLQLAVSLDYAIFLLHSFNKHRQTVEPPKAMQLAMKESLPTVAASAATTVVGFASLMFMRFGIGSDLGINLLKGVILSFISVMIFLPALTMVLYKAIDKTRHRKLLPDFKKSGPLLMKLRIPFLVLALLVMVPAYLGQTNTRFMYGMGNATQASRVGRDTRLIDEKFGRENILALVVPKDSTGREEELVDELSGLTHVTSIVSYVTSVSGSIPVEYVPKEAYEQFYSDNYSRIILNTDTSDEGTDAFETVQAVMDITAKYYDEYYLAGTPATLYDMKNIISSDTTLINIAAIIGIFIVILLTFRSLSLPVILLFTIETAIWINLSIPYFTASSINFVGYLIISTVQLGATVDYAILFTNSYLSNRKSLPKKDAMKETISNNLIAVLTSAAVLSFAGFVLALASDNPIIQELGKLLGRGTLLSLTMVALVLPALLVLLDGVVRSTTLKAR